MNRTDIEYGTHHWPVFTGCSHTIQECPTWTSCWARVQHRRFKRIWTRLYNPDFSPRFNPCELDAPRHFKKPARILVAFMGDLFSQEMHLPVPQFRVRRILDVVEACPQCTFLFLTKNPSALAAWNPWPSNAWVGTSITGAETPERQGQITYAMSQVVARVKWLSYEPMLGPLGAFLEPFQWLVLGAQSGPEAIAPQQSWVERAEASAELIEIPIWMKNNLRAIFPTLPERQELP